MRGVGPGNGLRQLAPSSWLTLLLPLSRILLLLLLLARSKLVLDFTLTLHLLHLLTTTFYTRALPRNLLWWALQALSAGVMAVGGVWACRWRELRPMSFGGGESGRGREGRGGGREISGGGADREEGGRGDGEEEGGYEIGGKGRGRGRGRDGGGLYEMVGMK